MGSAEVIVETASWLSFSICLILLPSLSCVDPESTSNTVLLANLYLRVHFSRNPPM